MAIAQKFDYCHRDAGGIVRCREETEDITSPRPPTISFHLYWSDENETVYHKASTGRFNKFVPKLTYMRRKGQVPMCTIAQWDGPPKGSVRETDARSTDTSRETDAARETDDRVNVTSSWSPCTFRQMRAVQIFEERLAATVHAQDCD